MPKIIENLEARLTEEAKKQIEENGYAAVTIRSVAKACGVGVGTVYNYFPSKDALLAAYMLQDWKNCVTAIDAVSRYSDRPEMVARCMYDQLCAFAANHAGVFRDEAAAAGFAGSYGRYHDMLRHQLAEPLRKFCESEFAADFAAESLLVWTMSGKQFEEIWDILKKLF